MRHVGLAAGKEVIYTQHIFATGNEAIAKVGAEESGAAGYEGSVRGIHLFVKNNSEIRINLYLSHF